MKIAMIGSGAAGSVFAAYLCRGGAEMYLVDRYKAHMDKIAQEGLQFTEPSGTSLLTGFKTCYSAEGLGLMDIIVIMVKATQTDDIMPSLAGCIGENTVVVSLQNGLGNDECIAKYLPIERVLYGFGTIGTELPEPGRCVSKPEPGIIMRFGAAKESPASIAAGEYLERCFKAGGCEASFEKDIRPFVWKKVISNSGYNTLSALLRLRVGDFLNAEDGEALIKQVWREGCDVAEKVLGIDLWDEMMKELPNIRAGFGTYYPSMAQDVLIHQRQTEISLLNGAIVANGEKYGVPTPVNTAMTRMIKLMQAAYDKQYVKK